MARRPLYPVTPGETAIDRLLNQTLPNILKEERERQEREELREEERARYSAEFKYRVERDTKYDSDNFKKQDTDYTLNIEKAIQNNDFAGAKSYLKARNALYSSNPEFIEEGMMAFAEEQEKIIGSGEELTGQFERNNDIIDSDASPFQKLSAYKFNEKNKDKVNAILRSKFDERLKKTDDPSLRFIMNDRALLGLVQGYGTKFNALTATSDKLDAKAFSTLNEKELESLVAQLSPEDQLEYGNPSQDPVKNSVRNAKLEAIHKQNQTKIYNQVGEDVVNEAISQFRGTDGITQTITILRGQDLLDLEDTLKEQLVKGADFATRGTAARIKADAEGKTAEHVLAYLDGKGVNTGIIFDKAPVKPKSGKKVNKQFQDQFEDMSDRDIVKLIMDPNKDDALLSREEQYILVRNKRRLELESIQEDRILNSAEENELKGLVEELSPYASELRLLTNQNYLNRRASGKPTRNLKGLPLAKGNVKGALKMVEDVENMESYVQTLSNSLKSSLTEPERPFGEDYVIPEKILLSEEAKEAYSKANQLLYGKKKILVRQNKSDVEKMIDVLNKRIIATDKKISKEIISIKGAYNLLANKTLTEMINTSEDGSQDISYLLLDRE
tara:strand:- start:5738 stop:7582 length:1845 start_codon:yes stop_codon:yes gene_type:complete